MKRAEAGLGSLAEPVVETIADLAELVLAILGVTAKLERRRIMEGTARGRADAKANGVKWPQANSDVPSATRGAPAKREGETQRGAARSYNVSQARISRLPPVELLRG